MTAAHDGDDNDDEDDDEDGDGWSNEEPALVMVAEVHHTIFIPLTMGSLYKRNTFINLFETVY